MRLSGSANPVPRWVAVAALLGAAAAPAWGKIAASLQAADKPDPAVAPFRVAKLTIEAADDEGGRVVRAVSLREVRGGPRFIYDVTLAAGTKHTLDVALPAVSQEQKYHVEFLAEDRYPAPVLGEVIVAVRWPAEQITDLAFLAPEAYEPWREELPMWPGALRRNLFIALVLTCLAAGGAALIAAPALRAGALVFVAAAATVVMAWLLQDVETVVQRETEDGQLLVLRCRRTAVWSTRDTGLVPVYFDAWHMRQDNMVLHAGREIRLELDPRRESHRLRLFRRPRPTPRHP